MENFNELARMSSVERFICVLEFVTTGIKNDAVLEATKKALLGRNETKIEELITISELCAKSFINSIQSDCLIDLAQVN